MRKLIPIVVLLFIILSVSVYAGIEDDCSALCKSDGYEYGSCANYNCNEEGWTDASNDECGVWGDCCCSNGVESLSAGSMCSYLADGLVKGNKYTCDFPGKGETANYFCEEGVLQIECKDCGFFACGDYKYFTLGNAPSTGVDCKCGIDSEKGICNEYEKVPEGDCSDEEGEIYWGFNLDDGGGTSDTCNNDGVIEEGEECDGDALAGKTCYEFPDGIGGTLACNDDCTYDTDQCVFDTSGGITNNCDVAGETQCFGLTLKSCNAVGERLDWVTVEAQSEECCQDADCSSSKCSAAGGTWMPSAPSPDFTMRGYCCGDDTSDLGVQFANKLCIKDPNFRWAVGVEGGRWVQDSILFCGGVFQKCYTSGEYTHVPALPYCTNRCDYYCDPISNNRWIPDNNPEVLEQPLSEEERIDTQSSNLEGGLGCCPASWCWDGTTCIENQVDEPLNSYVYNHPSDGSPYRCIDGAWNPARQVYSWNFEHKGYCPNKDSQCLVGNFTYENNNQPDTYFSDEKPQCIADGQYILDSFCDGYNWTSRTSLVVDKMLEETNVNSNFKLYCDDYKSVLNEYTYEVIGGKNVIEYLDSNCDIGDGDYPCVNNLCVLRILKTGEDKVIFGTSLNVEFFDEDDGLFKVLDVPEDHCLSHSTEGPFEYTQCGPVLIHNPNVSIVVFSDEGVSAVPLTTGWDLFLQIIGNPIEALTHLLIDGDLRFFSTIGLPLNFEVLNSSRMFDRLYIGQFPDGEKVEGIFESEKFDSEAGVFKHYLIVKYSGFEENICDEVNKYTSTFGRINCEEQGDDFIVADSREQPSYLMGKWQDLTSKFRQMP